MIEVLFEHGLARAGLHELLPSLEFVDSIRQMLNAFEECSLVVRVANHVIWIWILIKVADVQASARRFISKRVTNSQHFIAFDGAIFVDALRDERVADLEKRSTEQIVTSFLCVKACSLGLP